MAGSNGAFDAQLFRDSIRSAMRMGAPAQPSERVTFRWVTTETFAVHDAAQRPYQWDAPATAVDTITDLQVDCAAEFSGGTTVDATAVGAFAEARLKLTVLDTEYETIVAHGHGRLPDLVKAADAIYEIRFVEPPLGLFEVTVYLIHCAARGEH